MADLWNSFVFKLLKLCTVSPAKNWTPRCQEQRRIWPPTPPPPPAFNNSADLTSPVFKYSAEYVSLPPLTGCINIEKSASPISARLFFCLLMKVHTEVHYGNRSKISGQYLPPLLRYGNFSFFIFFNNATLFSNQFFSNFNWLKLRTGQTQNR